uniref:C3H1-type domain-containing protein n=1 Tax=Mucochytrium quahogii TaxID=96639 RepID=A0A7S2RDR5_9STRA|mmetsp:Transcript_7108/g.11297  ORF Transcript_7108/g.11297 Transcript_7108/m.11297 type:complete len:497 (-) Transcript_7108:120-1610(-)|eukprot:CAMPEP_0203763320 /NCGR_PEP_ID=MMETSP0098-20131031/16016_1 /ASSEMBLY_ACC=CAM_ASM_000208 /TAXON_ID=96639 /ORGANISM=" , Strain NY0313808BC1" /LENGTH=496 /DNA_ID=CAMNT_0050658033 /DNA_START=366 /DNA_END=1856 /DNA_ORIENTATION=+
MDSSDPVESGAGSGGEDEKEQRQDQTGKDDLYKTELCRKWQTVGSCRYGDKCQFAHGLHELRTLVRHPLYKTSMCKSFQSQGTCRYGNRCRFIHDESEYYLSTLPRGVATLNLNAEAGAAATVDGSFPRVPSAPANLSSYNQHQPSAMQVQAGNYQQHYDNGTFQSISGQQHQVPRQVQMQQHAGQQRVGHRNDGRAPPGLGGNRQNNRSLSMYGGGHVTSASAMNLASLNQPGLGFPVDFEDFQAERGAIKSSGEQRMDGGRFPQDTNGSMFAHGFAPHGMDASQIPVAGGISPPSPLSPPMVSRNMRTRSDVELKASASAVALSTLASPDSASPSSPNTLGIGYGNEVFGDMNNISLPPRNGVRGGYSSGDLSRSASQPVFHQQQYDGFSGQGLFHQEQPNAYSQQRSMDAPPLHQQPVFGRHGQMYSRQQRPANGHLDAHDSMRKTASVNELCSSNFFSTPSLGYHMNSEVDIRKLGRTDEGDENAEGDVGFF